MKKQYMIWIIISTMIMLLLPKLAVTFIKGDNGMAVCFILFFIINPIYSYLIGSVAGQHIKTLWSLPVLSALLFLIGTWLFFSMNELAFILYAIVYLLISIVAMFLSMLIHRKNKSNTKK